MDLYSNVSYETSKVITLKYSTSFSSSTMLFAKDVQPHIYAVYGLVRIADEIVDTYRGADATVLLHDLEKEVYSAIERGYSTNPIVHSFALTAKSFGIDSVLIAPFFESMLMDIKPKTYNPSLYSAYIHGSAEVVGLMCLKVFVGGNKKIYSSLKSGAKSLGAAYQKINFLRDLAADYTDLGRLYFPGVTFADFDDAAKNDIIKDIETDLISARKAVSRLPDNSRGAVALSMAYYEALLRKLKDTPASIIKQKRVRISSAGKLKIFAKAKLRKRISYGA